MPRFYFNIVNDTFVSNDLNGCEFAGLDEACQQARRTIGAIIAEEITKSDNSIQVSVNIRDERGQSVADLVARTRVISTTNPFVD